MAVVVGVLLLYLAKSWVVGSQSLRREKGGGKKKEKKKKETISLQTKHEWLFHPIWPFTSISPTKHDKWLFTLCPTISSSPTTPLLSGFSNLLNSCLLYYEGGGFKIFFNITKATWFHDPPFSSFDNSKIWILPKMGWAINYNTQHLTGLNGELNQQLLVRSQWGGPLHIKTSDN